MNHKVFYKAAELIRDIGAIDEIVSTINHKLDKGEDVSIGITSEPYLTRCVPISPEVCEAIRAGLLDYKEKCSNEFKKL